MADSDQRTAAGHRQNKRVQSVFLKTMYQSLITRYKLLTDQMSEDRLAEVLKALESVLAQKIPGDVVEFGCYSGTTSVFLMRLMHSFDIEGMRQLHLYDSFEGLPDKSTQDASSAGTQFKAGELKATRKQLLENFKKASLPKPIVTKAWFGDIIPAQLPKIVAFGFVDGDFYQSILDSLQLIWPKLSDGGIIAVDDYEREALPGVSRAVKEFYDDKQVKLTYAHHIAIIKKS